MEFPSLAIDRWVAAFLAHNVPVILLRISAVMLLDGFRVRLALIDGSVIDRDVEPLLVGPVFDAVRNDPDVFRGAKVAGGTVVWPNGADLCPDVLIWGGPPREGRVPDKVRLAAHPG